MKREPLLTDEYFKKCIDNYDDKIVQKKALLASNSSEVKRWDMVYAFLFDAQLHNVYNKYSIGVEVSEIVPLIKEATGNFITYINHPTARNTLMKDSFYVYEECLSILSLNVIIQSEIETINKLALTFDILGRDMLIDKMLSYVLPARKKVSNKLAWPKAYEKLYLIFEASREDQPKLMEEYLEGWYKSMRKASWYGAHKNKEVCMFSGYWSVESAAVTNLLDIDDNMFKNMPFYPKDLVDYSRSK